MFPPGVGQFMAGGVGAPEQIINLFSNFTWSSPNLTVAQMEIVRNWSTYRSGIFCHLSVFIAFTVSNIKVHPHCRNARLSSYVHTEVTPFVFRLQFFFSILCLTMPVPCGSFVPVFKIGAAFGRIIGELMAIWYPTGL